MLQQRSYRKVFAAICLQNVAVSCLYVYKYRNTLYNNLLYISTHRTNYFNNILILRAISTLNKINNTFKLDFSIPKYKFKFSFDNKELFKILLN